MGFLFSYLPPYFIKILICNLFNVGLDYFSENYVENYTFKKNENNNIIVGKIETLNNTMPEGIIENIIKRLGKLGSLILKIPKQN